MNKNKIKWLYKKTARRYHPYRCFLWENLDDVSEWNLPWIRKKSGYRNALKINDICREFSLKCYSKERLWGLDNWSDDPAMASRERKSWKRNSKRSHQWKHK